LEIQYKEIEKIICAAISGGSGPSHEGQPNTIVKAVQTDHVRDTNILDILARIRRRDTERGEEVLQQYPASPPDTSRAESEVPSETHVNNGNDQTTGEGISRQDTEEYFWHFGLESDHIFGSLDTIFDGFGGPSLNIDPQDLERLYREQS